MKGQRCNCAATRVYFKSLSTGLPFAVTSHPLVNCTVCALHVVVSSGAVVEAGRLCYHCTGSQHGSRGKVIPSYNFEGCCTLQGLQQQQINKNLHNNCRVTIFLSDTTEKNDIHYDQVIPNSLTDYTDCKCSQLFHPYFICFRTTVFLRCAKQRIPNIVPP